MCLTTGEKSYSNEEKKDDERIVWESMTPMAWHNSVASKDSIFCKTYKLTRRQIEDEVKAGGYDCVIEVGCGTGDIIGELQVNVQCFGLDINMEFLDFCRNNHPHDHCEFLYGDATDLQPWFQSFDGKYRKPLVICVNNTLPIMPEHIRGKVVAEMLAIAGERGRCLVSYWNGNFFSHAVMNYYQKNQDLCGTFDVDQHVDWETRTLVTPSNYSTTWFLTSEVQSMLHSCDIDVTCVRGHGHVFDEDHINTQGLGIFVWFTQAATSRAKAYYDSEDAQKFYSSIWGTENTHIGRYDLLTAQDKKCLPLQKQILKAQVLHEQEFCNQIRTMLDTTTKLRIVDFGCGFGGLLRRLWQEGLVWSAAGCDISGKMCEQARALNAKLDAGCDKDVTILEESYLDVSVSNESTDLVISMDALLHVGPERQHRAMQEAARILRPGGWIIFTDILQAETVNAEEMKPIYDRIHLSKLGTVSNYKQALTAAGFSNFSFEEHSSNVPAHYGSVREVLLDKADEIGISKDYATKMESGLRTWRDLAPANIRWGFLRAQKTKKIGA